MHVRGAIPQSRPLYRTTGLPPLSPAPLAAGPV